MTNENRLIVIAGPTGIGKTDLAVQLAQHLHTEIISADSRQFYKELNIGVAKPSAEQLATVRHHFVGHISIHQHYDAAAFEADAILLLGQLFRTHNTVIMTGGSGLFIDAVLNGFDPLPPRNEELREQLVMRLENEGLESLTRQLKQVDEESYNTVDINNPRRVLRALEICLSGQRASEVRKKENKPRNFTAIKIALDMDRDALYKRINHRVDLMMQEGLLKEVESLLPYRHLNALQTVGYKELFAYFDGNTSLEKAVDLIKQHSRNYAKRQLTWFRKDKEYQWYTPDKALSGILKNL